jgi:hypothetical protein
MVVPFASGTLGGIRTKANDFLGVQKQGRMAMNVVYLVANSVHSTIRRLVSGASGRTSTAPYYAPGQRAAAHSKGFVDR